MSSNLWKSVIPVLMVLGSGPFGVHAQTVPIAAPTTALTTTGTTGTVGSEGVRAGNTRNAQVQASQQEQLTNAQTIVERGTSLSQRVTQMLDDARREADVIRVTCLNDKLTQINANLRTAQSRLGSVQKTVDVDQRNHEYIVMTVLGQKLQALDQKANQCVGQWLYDTGPTKVGTEIDTRQLPFERDASDPQLQAPNAPSLLGIVQAPPAQAPALPSVNPASPNGGS
jgi:hypothetical protein